MAGDIYYAKTGLGTRVAGSVTTLETGAFGAAGLLAADVYASVTTALTGGAGAGDFILASNAHLLSQSGSITWTGPAPSTTGQPLFILSVDDSAADQLAAGAKETCTSSGSDFSMKGHVVTEGISNECGDIHIVNTESTIIRRNCSITQNNSNNTINAAGDGVYLTYEDVTVSRDTTSQRFFISNGATFRMRGGVISASGTGHDLCSAGFAVGGGTAIFEGVDLSAIDNDLLNGVGGNVADDAITLLISGCKMNAGYVIHNETFVGKDYLIEIIRSAATSAAAEYQYIKETPYGLLEDDTVIVRDESIAYHDSGEKVSWKVDTTALASKWKPFEFVLPGRFIPMETAATDQIDIFFASTTALDDSQVWAEIIYHKGPTGGSLKHEVYIVGTRLTDLLGGTPTAHADDSGSSDWRDGAGALSGYNEYKLTIDTTQGGTVTGLDSAPEVRIFVGVDAVIYFDTSIELSA